MEDKRALLISVLSLAVLAAAGCGGGSSSESSLPPVDGPASLKLELFTGKATVDFAHCSSSNGAAAAAEYSHLLRATVYKDGVYLAETGEGCTNVAHAGPGSFIPVNLRPAIRKVSGGAVETAVRLNDYIAIGGSRPVMSRYPSGFHRPPGGGESFVLGYAAASSTRGFALDAAEAARYTAQGGWDVYVPGLFRYKSEHAGYDDLVAGTPGKPPARVDGQGQAAGLVAPHDLEVDASGAFYLIDEGRIRTIDAGYKVATLDSAALGIEGAVKALDADRQGRIHVLAQRAGPSYSWHRLADGSKVDFRVRDFVFTEVMTYESFTVVGNDLLLAVRDAGSDGGSRLYRVSGNGTVTPLTTENLLPQVQHIEYGVDGHLYVVLPQGVLIARDFK